MARTNRDLYTPPAVLRLFRVTWVDVSVLRIVRVFTIIAFIAAAAGVLQPISAVAVFLGFALLHAVNSGALGSNHSTHAALYTLFGMMFSVSYDGPTVDGVLANQLWWPHLVHSGSVLESGFAPTFVLVALVYIMFAAGISKLLNGGYRWLDGKCLRYYIQESIDFSRFPRLARAVIGRAWLCRGLAVVAAIVELSAPVAIFVAPQYRAFFVLAWCAFHIGILSVMMPAYWIQMWCYLLVLDWYKIGSVVLRRSLHPPVLADTSSIAATALTSLGVAFCFALIIVLIRQLEEWPFTTVPMYSNGVPPTELVLPTREQLHARAIRALQGRSRAWNRPWVSDEIQEDVRLVRLNATAAPLYETVVKHGVPFVRWSQYAKVVRSVAIADIASKPADKPDLLGPDLPASRFLNKLAKVVRQGVPDWKKYGRIELICKTADGWLVTGRAQIGDVQPDARKDV